MKCARLRLQDRSKLKPKSDNSPVIEKPRRYCQKRLVNPEHEEDPRWTDVFERFHCNTNTEQIKDFIESDQTRDTEDLFLTVQTLKFPGDAEQDSVKRPKTSFKYKTFTDGNKHRMFVKQAVIDDECNDDGRSTQLTYYFDDYIKYLFNNDRSRPNSSKSGIFLRGINASLKENKATQVHTVRIEENKKKHTEGKIKGSSQQCLKSEMKEEVKDETEAIKNAKITYRKTGKRKSLTISRAQSPETVQVIRVDVVCNYTGTPMSDYEDNKNLEDITIAEQELENISVKNTHFANKYLLTNTIKTLDESLSGGAKVTLLCKTFKLSDRSKMGVPKLGIHRNHTRALKDVTRNENKAKSRKQLLK